MLLATALAGPAPARVRVIQGPRVAPRVAKRKPSPAPNQPTAELPRRWRMPTGWRNIVRELPSGGVVEYLSGLDSRLWARLYSWPQGDSRGGAQDARRQFVREFDMKVMQGTSAYRGREIRQTLWGWTDSKKKDPDIMLKTRCLEHEGRLLVVVAGVTDPEDPSANPEQELDDMLQRISWPRLPRLAWGRGGY